MNDIREMVRADLAARLKATVKRRRPKPKGMLQRAAIAAAHVDVDEDDVASEIRDARLYRQTHGTFEDYCKERWGMSRPRAYQLIEAAGAVEVVSTIVDKAPATESQARPLIEAASVVEVVSPIGDKAPATESQAEAKERQRWHGAAPGRSARNTSDQKTGSVGEARDEAASMMNQGLEERRR